MNQDSAVAFGKVHGRYDEITSPRPYGGLRLL